jgi:hypothetical protein
MLGQPRCTGLVSVQPVRIGTTAWRGRAFLIRPDNTVIVVEELIRGCTVPVCRCLSVMHAPMFG